MIRLQTIDAHCGGDPLRLVVGGYPAPVGNTMAEKRAWAGRHADRLRRLLLFEPRGHADMTGALLTEATSPGSHAGVLFMDGGGYSAMSGHGVIAVTTIALERGLIDPGADKTHLVLDTPAGAVRVRPRFARLAAEPAADRTNELAASGRVESEAGAPRSRVEAVAYVNVPSFVLHAGIPVKLPARTLRADVAYGGRFYAIVDSEAAGVGVDRPHAPELRRTGMAIGRAIESAYDISHPLDRTLRGIDGVVFTGPAAEADLRAATVFGSAQLSRSPSGTAAAAVIAVLDAMGLVAENGCVVHEGLIGTQFRCKIAGRTVLADQPAVIPEIEGSAWITGEHTLLADDSDPLADGFRL